MGLSQRDQTKNNTLLRLGTQSVKKEGYFPYGISTLHELKLEDYTPCYNDCDWFLQISLYAIVDEIPLFVFHFVVLIGIYNVTTHTSSV